MSKNAKKISMFTEATETRGASQPRLGDLIAAAFDNALAMTKDPKKAAEIASLVVQRALKRTGQVDLLERLALARC